MEQLYQQLIAVLYSIWQRRWHAILTAWGVCFVGWIVVYSIPDKYESNARIYVNTDSVLRPLMRGLTVEMNLTQQIDVMQQTLFSHTNLEKVLRMTDLDLEATSPKATQAQISQLSANTKIEIQGPNLFKVSYEHENPEVARRIVQALLTIFVESNLGASRKDLAGARRFIDNQLKEYERQLQEVEKRRSDFKRANMGFLPGEGNYYQRLEDSRVNLTQSQAELREAEIQLSEMKKHLNSLPQYIEAGSAAAISASGPAIGGAAGPATGGASTVMSRMGALQAEIENLTTRYTENHPDVVLAQRRLESLKRDFSTQQKGLDMAPGASAPTGGAAMASNPVYEQMLIKVIDQETRVAVLKGRVLQQQRVIEEVNSLAKTVPVVEAEMSRLDRDYGILKQRYDELLGTRESARIATDLETDTDNVQFRVVDPPSLPLKPASPDRPTMLSLVLLAGIAVGVGVAFLMSQIHSTYLTVQRLRDEFALPVLGSISAVILPEARRQRLIEVATFGAVCGGLLFAYGAVLVIEYWLRAKGA